MISFFEFTDFVLARPPMFGINNTKELALYLKGYIRGLKDGEAKNLDEVSIFDDNFKEFVMKELGIENSAHPWEDMIMFHSGSYHNSIELFKHLFNQFKQKFFSSQLST